MFRRGGWRLAGVLALVLTVAGCGSPSPPQPEASKAPTVADECPRWAPQARAVEFGQIGAKNLKGLVIGTGTVGIVLAHQLDTTLCDWMPVAKKLADRGYRVLAFDFNDFGVSGGTVTDIDLDVAAATAFLRADGAGQVVLIGASMGGTAVIVAAADITPPVAGAVNLSGPQSFGNVSVAGVKAAPRLTVPVLYEAADGDGSATSSAQSLYDATPANLRTIAIVSGSEHGVALLLAGGTLQGWPALDAFLAAHAPVAG
jgi:pimeloyl-ACP methyl ester carboxylesterase